MRQSLLENKRLIAMIGFAEKLNVPFVPAEVTGRTIIEMRSYITINRGSASGISEGMSVRTDAGLTGVVTAVTNNYSLVEILLNRNIRIASKIQRNGITGIVSWEGGNNLYLKNIPETFDIQIGDVILTSNYSNKYPEDIPIGQIINIEKDPSSLFLKVTVKPFVNFASLEEVFVIKQLPDPERISLIKEMQKRLQLMKGSD
jgi:rod shape-determining protein MreC